MSRTIEADSALQVIAFAYEGWQNAYGRYLDVEFPVVEVNGLRARVQVEDEEGGDSIITAYFDDEGKLDAMIDDCHGELQVVIFDGAYCGGGVELA